MHLSLSSAWQADVEKSSNFGFLPLLASRKKSYYVASQGYGDYPHSKLCAQLLGDPLCT